MSYIFLELAIPLDVCFVISRLESGSDFKHDKSTIICS
jgi:hypothetical protein